METAKFARPRSVCSYRASVYQTGPILNIPFTSKTSIAPISKPDDSLCPKEITTSGYEPTGSTIATNSTQVSNDKLHKDLDTLHDKISKLESRLKNSKNFTTTRPPLLPRSKSRQNTHESTDQYNTSQVKQEVTSVCNTERSMQIKNEIDTKNTNLICNSARNLYTYSAKSLLSKTAKQALEQQQNKENTNKNSQNVIITNDENTERLMKNSENQTNEIVIQTKHEVLMQLTNSLEIERKKNAEFKQEIEIWKNRSVALESKYNSLKDEYDELLSNYKASEELRRKQKSLLKDLNTENNNIKKPKSCVNSGVKPKKHLANPKY